MEKALTVVGVVLLIWGIVYFSMSISDYDENISRVKHTETEYIGVNTQNDITHYEECSDSTTYLGKSRLSLITVM